MKGKTKLAIGSIIAALVGTVCFSVAAFADTSSNASGDISAKEALITKVADNLGLQYDQVLGAFDKAQQEMSSEALQQRLAQAVNGGTITQDEADQITAWMNSEPAAAANLSKGWLNGLMHPSGNFSGSVTFNQSNAPDMGRGFHGMGLWGNTSGNTSRTFPTRPMGNFSDNMSQWDSANHMRPSGNFSDHAAFNQSSIPDRSRGFFGMRPSGNSSYSGTDNTGNMLGGSKLSPEEYLQNAVDNGTITQAEADDILAWINAMPEAMTKIGAFQHNGLIDPSGLDFCPAPF